MSDTQDEKPGLIRSFVDIFKDKLKELNPRETAIVFIVLAIIMTFGIIGFTSAIAGGVVKLIQVIGAIAASAGI